MRWALVPPRLVAAAGFSVILAGLPALRAEPPAAKRSVPSLLQVGDQRFDATGGEPSVEPRWRAAGDRTGGLRPFLIKFDARIEEAWLERVRQTGAEVVQYQPHHGLLLLIPPPAEAQLDALERITFTGEYHGIYKAAAGLRARADLDHRVTLRVIYFDVPAAAAAIDALRLRGARVAHVTTGASTSFRTRLRYVVFEAVDTRDMPWILVRPEVYWAEEWLPPTTEDERAAQIVAGNLDAGAPLPGYHAWLGSLAVDGSGVVVAVADTGLDSGDPATIHPDFADRVSFGTALCADGRDRNGHGTNVASIAVGDPRPAQGTGLVDAEGFYWGAGAAPGAGLYVQKALELIDCGSSYNAEANVLARDAVANGDAQIGNHSFTDNLGNGIHYNSQAQAWDARVRDADDETPGNQPYAVIFSAGNAGPLPSTLTSPKAAKNIVTVAATENWRPGQCPGLKGPCGGSADDVDALVEFSSRGPTSDGRLKPDVSAPGHVIGGARSSVATFNCACDPTPGTSCCASSGVDGSSLYTVYSGTSQAAPRVAGASALVFDWYADRFGSFPSPAMNKALLIHGAVDMGVADVPNIDEGWGRIDLGGSLGEDSISLLDQATVLGTVGDSEITADLYAQNPARAVRATLVWTDAPGAVACNPCLVNDLDLLATLGPTVWRGNHFVDGFSATPAVPDTLNNVEAIRLAPGATGCSPVQVTVRASALNGDGVPGNPDDTDQDFALALSNLAETPAPAILGLTSAGLAGGCDGDAFADRRETAELTLTVTNLGCSTTIDVRGSVTPLALPEGTDVAVSPVDVAIGSIAAGESVNVPWLMTLSDDDASLCNQPVELRLELADAGAGRWTETFTLTLDADAIVPVIEADPADEDRSVAADDEWSLQSCRTTSGGTSWHMGDPDCTGIPDGPGLTQDLVFEYPLGADDVLRQLSFQHAFDGVSDLVSQDSVEIGVDAWDSGLYAVLETWGDGQGNPQQMTLAGPYGLAELNADRADVLRVRFRFTSGGNWPNSLRRDAAGWDVDDVMLEYDAVTCDGGSCPPCTGAPDAVSDGSGGTPGLQVSREGGSIVLDWPSHACSVRYNLYAGTIGSDWNHAIFTAAGLDGADSCHEPVSRATFEDPGGDLYFLVTADNGSLESHAGSSDVQDPRPFVSPACSPHE